ncbi:MAG: glycosyltransferase, partial [Candidatus Binatia bacterium]
MLTSSHALEQRASLHNPLTVLIRNACEHERFARRPDGVFRDPQARRVIGYYGAIAEWFDVDLVRSVARRFPDHLVLLVGADTVGCASSLAGCGNVQGIGEVPYDRLPGYLHGMDVCLIPFLINDLTMATNPVKLYEYLSAAKPVVATDLPELREAALDRLVYRTASRDGFLEGVRRALGESSSDPIRRERVEYAARQTWDHRSEALRRAIDELADRPVSIVMVTHNNLALTRRCVDSLRSDTSYSNFELIVVDNASTDATPAYLEQLAASDEDVKVVLNAENRGFAAANNQGLAIASGEFLVLLNNDTVVTPGWIRTLVNHLERDPAIGIIGPITNNIGNEARVATSYSDVAEMPAEAYQLTRARLG